jgi:hypothetical protein
MYAFDAPLVARFFAIEELRAAGWKHRPDPALAALPRARRDDAERMWSGATFCPECAARAAGGAGAAGASRKTPPTAHAQAFGRERRVDER